MGFSKTTSSLLVVVPFFVLLILIFLFLSPLLYQQVMKLIGLTPEYISSFYGFLLSIVERFDRLIPQVEFAEIKASVAPEVLGLGKWIKVLLTNIISNTFALINMITLLLKLPVVLYFLLKDWDAMREKIYSWLPKKKSQLIKECLSEMDKTISGYLRGQAMVCLILACLYAIGLWIAGLEFGILIGIITGVLSFIPYVGAFTGFVISMIAAIYQFNDWQSIAMVAVAFGTVQVLEGAFLTPKIIGGKVGLHPLWIIFAILAGGFLLGFVGVLIAVPLAAMIGVLVRYGVKAYLASPFYND
jgi:predicted PurR-regulated permease PerM